MSTASGSAMLAGNPSPAPAGDATPPATAPASAPAANASWYDTIEDGDLKGYVQNKGWSSPVELANGYRNLEKLLGGEKLPLPKGDADAEGWSRVYDALGRPKEAAGYKIAVPDGADPTFAQAAAGKFHELGLSTKQASALAEWWNGQSASMMQTQQQQTAAQAEQQLQSLKQEWGQTFDENVEMGRRAARQFGLDADKLNKMETALGTGEMLKLMASVGRGLGEDKFVTGQTPGFGMTPEAAKQRISALQGDPDWRGKYLNGNADARAEMQKLMAAAYPE